MTPEQQIKAIAELDGWTWKPNVHGVEVWHPPGNNEWQYYDSLPPAKYLTSYDAIIPVIQKAITNDDGLCVCFIEHLNVVGKWSPCIQVNMARLFDFSPAQLCEALLRATGKWEE